MPTIYAIGRNYAAHAREMGADPAADVEPVVFLKPWASRIAPPGPVPLPAGAKEVHHEAEVVLRIGAPPRVDAVALGLDLTDRGRQSDAKKQGLPWARAKGFRASSPLGPFVSVDALPPLGSLRFALAVNGRVRQRGDTSLWLRPVEALLQDLDRWFGLERGDLIFTGTPEGVGPIGPGDVLDLSLEGVPAASARFTVA
jgi:2-keto-4-pentenoate hydratase/2-oxohepta-3-ene-1,7-dioic acid hydratase in catechol pathway